MMTNPFQQVIDLHEELEKGDTILVHKESEEVDLEESDVVRTVNGRTMMSAAAFLKRANELAREKGQKYASAKDVSDLAKKHGMKRTDESEEEKELNIKTPSRRKKYIVPARDKNSLKERDMKTYKELMESLAEAWPGTPEWNAKYGKKPSTDRYDIVRKDGVTKATRRYDPKTGESEEPEAHKVAGEQPVKRGRGRPPGKYGSYKGYNRTGKYVGVHAARKQKTQEAFDHLMALESEEEIKEFMSTLDEDVFADLHEYLVELEESEVLDEMQQDKEYAEQIEEKHRVLVTISDPHHPMVSMRNTQKQKFVRVSAADKDEAIIKAKNYYSKRNYKVHGAVHVGMVNEEAEYVEEMQQGKEYSKDHIEKKIRTGEWEAVRDIKPGNHVELRHHTGKRVTVFVKPAPVKEEVEHLDESVKSYASFITRQQ